MMQWIYFRYAEQVVCASRPFALIAVTISTFGLIAVGLVLYTVSIRSYY